MSNYFELRPEVPGELGPDTIMDTSVHPPKVSNFHFIFDGWLGDHLVECFPCFLVARSLGGSFEEAGLTGFVLDEVAIERDEQLDEFEPALKIPEFLWLKISGEIDRDDFFITEKHYLGVSKRALDIIRRTSPSFLTFKQR
ncbi:hypothetical protein OJ996_25525 [Luteolibacter sp. GHJ8]|uniref:Uncharacterized protein n=1 Tax=Luteolibacter rhizosphaerae TaxID=2989719 RepID=A0ABT3GAX7_9BACT|nr:hypothetical protein [Luteolibacter rhizosphaerae]MCW1916975.1 hypothetical protein [Luteolibacter rhizosphaerae]